MSHPSGAANKSSWGRRLGLLVPSANAVVERDVRRMAVGQASFHVARMPLTRDEESQIERLVEDAPGVAQMLVDAGVDVIGFCCTTGSLLKGAGYDREIIRELEGVTKVPVTTTATAVVKRLEMINVRQLLLLSPYEAWLQEKVIAFLEAHGFRVVREHHWSYTYPRDIESVTPRQIVDVAVRQHTSEIDAVFVACTDFRGVEAAIEIERSLGVPCVASNWATVWQMMELAGSRVERSDRGPVAALHSSALPEEVPEFQVVNEYTKQQVE